MKSIAIIAALLLLPSLTLAEKTQRQYLSGTDKDNTVNWDFLCTAGRNSGNWTTIPVPSNWEFHGFGNFTYGQDDTRKPVDEGHYRHSFTVPAGWSGMRIFIVFEGSMTDTEVKINDQLAGPVHQGAFYRFRYDVTKLLKLGGTNRLEAHVKKMSADPTVNRAERQSDYWVFGGIFRPVYLEALPMDHIERVAIDAKADGSFAIDVYPQAKEGQIEAQIQTLDGQNVGSAMTGAAAEQVKLTTKIDNPRNWTSETPNLYKVIVSLKQGGQVVHQIEQRFGFRTVEVREGDGIYINGVRIILKGVNRHSFWPDSGRTLSRKVHLMDIAAMKEMNMNSVRMSHYPPDVEFLDLCDELGLYVLDELAGWQKAYGTEPGRKLVESMIKRDVNHPSIIFWDNGNEGGWNTELDAYFAKWDPQKRQVLHPWAIHGPINTKHYSTYDQFTKLLAGPHIVLPTEFLHALYDGGGGAGLGDYWKAIRQSKVGAGGYIWALVDEGVKRVDLDGRIDTHGNRGPDGLVGPYREKEGSFYAVKEIWSPIVITATAEDAFEGRVTVENRYHFTNTNQCRFEWELRRTNPLARGEAGHTVVARGTAQAPAIAPGQSGQLRLGLPKDQKLFDALAVRAIDPNGMELWTWVWTRSDPIFFPNVGGKASGTSDADAITLSAAGTVVKLSKSTGEIISVTRNGKPISLSGGPKLATGKAAVTSIENRQDGDDHVVTVRYSGDMKTVTWRMPGTGLLQLDYAYELTGQHPFMGITFDYPEPKMKKLSWQGDGPYRVWKNRPEGVTYGVWETAYNDTMTGRKSWIYPEFRGYFANVRQAKLSTDEGAITFFLETEKLFFRLLSEANETDKASSPMKAATVWPEGTISILHGIPPIGNKFHDVKTVGPSSQFNECSGVYKATVYLMFEAK
jgi:hypothetical protein